ncbi:hypothetical protein ETR14_09375 [Sphingosinicella sp. BN140058]|nr:hypothetical protein ETR14_09375 [Sphingosinicella sp. BN140058]
MPAVPRHGGGSFRNVVEPVQPRLIDIAAQVVIIAGRLFAGRRQECSMRKALIGLVMSATVLTPVAAEAQNHGGSRAERIQQRYERQGERNQARVEARQQRQAVRQERQDVRQQRVEAPRQAPVQVQGNQGVDQRSASNWQSGERRRGEGGARREAYRQRIDATREASQRSAEGLDPRYQRQAARNQQRYEERLRDQRRDRRDDRRDWRNDRRDDRRGWQNDRGDYRQAQRWDRQWRNDRRYDWQNYRYAHRDLYRIGRYYSPYRDHSYSRLSIGFSLGSGFYGDRYWISDPWQYRLPPAYAGTRWVRYYDDVLLVDMYTGEVIDAIYDFFW